ncbi:hypothetical protein AMAG_00802 [Allomyces macrogynus ATCC 38327]|uniref:DM2 domain-containing protein n=1 Tax=Allomyces macrogynus (strain ATCC 38327) TaxID=578462 RepID=A0A0L0RWY2_ALLM3|nr:hypothetical protein AMAG_00802 [Allomyces macrogynus ATCC 38327]|eukprot:KNE54853.1 hypothetical protein AMAG_00802 [Allomyces macrogynus ATCC 38327]
MSASTRRRKPVERNLPPKIENVVPEAAFYKRMQETERKMDAIIMRKQVEIQDALAKPIKTRATLRIFVSNYAADQHHMEPTYLLTGGDGVPNWTLRIEGRIIEPSAPATKSKAAATPAPTAPPCKFSHFVQQILVEMDRDPMAYAGEPNVAEYYKNDANPSEFDGFEVKRRGDVDVKVKIVIRLDYGQDKFKLSKELARVLGFDVGGASKMGVDQLMSKSEVVLGLWQYIKQQKLLDQDDKRVVNCDDSLRQIFGSNQVLFPQIPDLITRCLLPPDPIVINYVVKVDQDFTASQYAYDVQVDIDDLATRTKLQSILAATDATREIADLDDQISAAITTLNNHRLKRDFLAAFAKDPLVFVNRYLESQNRDLEVILGTNAVNREEARRAEFYQQHWVRDAVVKYLTAKYRV